MSLFTPEIRHNVEAQSRVRQWASRLRSGRDDQARMELHPEAGRFCCLGVATDEFDSSRWQYHSSEQTFMWRGRRGNEWLYLPPDVIAAYCLRDAFGTFADSPGDNSSALSEPPCSLVQLNWSRSLPQIGEFIEQQLAAALAA